MSKAARIRREKRDERLRVLRRMNQCVAIRNGYDAECIQAVALLVASAQIAGHQLEPRAVALAAMGKNPEVGIVVGLKAAEAHDQVEAWTASPFSTGWNGAGHLIATLSDPPHIFDPSFAQFVRRIGEEPGFQGGNAHHFDGPEEEFTFEMGTLRVSYYSVAQDETWRQAYAMLVNEALESPLSQYIADLSRSQNDLVDHFRTLTQR